MSKEEIGQARILLFHQLRQSVFVLHHSVESLVAPIPPVVVYHGGLAVSHMVVGGYDESGVQEFGDHVQIAPGVLAEAVNQLDDAIRLRRGYVNPALHFVALVERFEADLV